MSKTNFGRRLLALAAITLWLLTGLTRDALGAEPTPCKTSHQPDLDPKARRPRFDIQLDGSVEFDADRPNTFRLPLSGVLRIVRTRAGEESEIACGPVGRGKTYAFELNGDKEIVADDHSVYRIDVFGTSPQPGIATGDARQARVREVLEQATSKQNELESNAEAVAHVKALTTRVLWAQLAEYASPARLDELEGALTSARGKLPPDVGFQKARKDAASELEGALRSIRLGDSALVDQRLKEFSAAALTAQTPLKDFDLCENDELNRNSRSSEPLLHLIQSELPGAADTVMLEYGQGVEDGSSMPVRMRRGILLNHVGRDTILRNRITYANAPEASIADIFRVALPAFIRAGAVKGLGAMAPGVPAPSFLCAVPTAAQVQLKKLPDRSLDRKPLAGLIAAYASQSFNILPAPKKQVLVVVCEGKECKEDGDSVRNKVVFPPEDHLRVAIAVELGVNLGMVGPTNAYGNWGYEQVAGNDTLTRSYALRNSVDVRNNTVVSLLVGARCDNWLFALGPGLVDFAGNEAVKLWNAKLGRRLAKDLFLTLGGGIRFVDYPRATEHDIRVLPIADAPLGAVTETKLGWSVGLGLALDLSLLADAGEKIVGGIQGAKR